ncbi:hypothetical protein Dda_2012 [Drechslerella dactyloides]|uniref:Uncharacterized protein n=1 Tax=Drechslerella dactyloides TaxID=74499 RepID=A0AAD6J2X8_DREDA|nr:hypothetical protein Dda_2012 [Drechslerella dactyloides]
MAASLESLLLPGQESHIFLPNNILPPTETSVSNLFSLKGKTAIVTGGGAGIGFAIVEAFAEAGANVALWYMSSKEAVAKAAKVSKTYGVTCKAYRVTITDEKSVSDAIDEVVRDLNGRLDIFVANAGIAWVNGRIIDCDMENFQNIFNINFMSALYAAKAAGKHFERQKKEGTNIDGEKLQNFHSGSFILNSSIASARQLMPHASTPYNITKAALTHFARCLAIEWVQFARVNSISPGYVSTEMLDNVPSVIRDPWKKRTPLGREGTVAEMKGAFLYFASDASSFTTGANLFVDGGILSEAAEWATLG